MRHLPRSEELHQDDFVFSNLRIEIGGHVDYIVSFRVGHEGEHRKRYYNLHPRDSTLDVMTGTPALKGSLASWDTSQY